MSTAINYLQPDVPSSLPWHRPPTVIANDDTLKGYGCLVSKEEYEKFPIEIVQWPKKRGRPIDVGTGNQAGTKKGIFDFWWEGDYLFGKNNAVNDEYLLGWSVNPTDAVREKETADSPKSVLLWHANYHPDGGQLFFPIDGTPFVTPLALPGDEILPEHFVNFYFDGTHGLYIHPNIWHEGIFPFAKRARFYDAQGSVHARVSVNFAREFGIFMDVQLGK